AAADALKSRVADFQRAWNAHDGAAVAACFTPDGDQIMDDGPLTQGKQALQEWWRNRFATTERGVAITLVVRTVRLISADVALLNVVATVPGGHPSQGKDRAEQDRGTWVMVRQAGQWFISALRVQAAEPPTGR